MSIPSLLRLAENKALSDLTLTGSVLDLGGDERSEYRKLIKGDAKYTTVNMSNDAVPDLMHDLEQPLPLPSVSFDHVLLINVLEHIFNYQQLLSESTRVLRAGGSLYIAVPFLVPIHPSPRDHWRFSEETLYRLLTENGFADIKVQPLSGGVFAACYLLINRLLPSPLRFLFFYTVRFIVQGLDFLVSKMAHLLGKKYEPAYYPLGYFVRGVKTDM